MLWLQSECSCWPSDETTYLLNLLQLPFEDTIYLIKWRYRFCCCSESPCVAFSLEFSQPTARPLSISRAHFPMETLSHGLRRMLTTPARAALRTPDSSDELRSSDAQPAGACAEEPADASAAAPARALLSVSNCCAAPSASSTTSAALQNPLPGPRSGSNPHEPDHASASAHDSDPFALTGTNYIPYSGRIPQVGSVPGYNQPVFLLTASPYKALSF